MAAVTSDRVLTTASKLARLREILERMGGLAVAYSGGVDSSFLLSMAARNLYREQVVAVTGDSETYPPEELEMAEKLASSLGVGHEVVVTEELADPRFRFNSAKRCYYCKRELFTKIIKLLSSHEIRWVADGTNYDDIASTRPGQQAARDFGVRSPLMEARLTKSDIRQLAKTMELPNWDKPAQACLASRFPRGTEITKKGLAQVAAAEGVLRSVGFRSVRVRHLGDIACIQLGTNAEAAILTRDTAVYVDARLKELGYRRVTVDRRVGQAGPNDSSK